MRMAAKANRLGLKNSEHTPKRIHSGKDRKSPFLNIIAERQ